LILDLCNEKRGWNGKALVYVSTAEWLDVVERSSLFVTQSHDTTVATPPNMRVI
jgi:hypothetical protein